MKSILEEKKPGERSKIETLKFINMFDNVREAVLTVFDNLESDEQSSEIIDLLDGGETDEEIKKGIQLGVARLKELGKTDVAAEVEEKTKGFAF
ncbi:MAG: hypothetical protein AABY15_02180 [Nanoarchaeota archaeon]